MRSTVLAFGLVLLAAAVGAASVVLNHGWYGTLHRPTFRPPTWVSAAVWFTLDLMTAWGFVRVLRAPDWMPDRPGAIRAFLVRLGLGALWPWVFFGLRSPKAGLIVMLALLGASVLCTRRFGQVDRAAGWWTMPYALWVAFAALISLSIAIRN